MANTHVIPPAALAELMKWEAANGVIVTDEFTSMNSEAEARLRQDAPWRANSRYFKKCFISALALVKIAMHAKTGHGNQGILSHGGTEENWIEVMGMMIGGVVPNAFVIRDSSALPGVASEASVSITEEGMMYLLQHKLSNREMGKPDIMCGWYHSHPGLGLFLSGADVKAQDMCQLAYEPSVALVIDPIRTIAENKVHIAAFRNYFETDEIRKNPQSAAARSAASGGQEDADISKKFLKELGAQAHCFFEIPIVVYKSSKDDAQLRQLWGQYWAQFLSSSPLTTTRAFLDERLKQLNSKLKQATRNGVQLAVRRGRGNGGQPDVAGQLVRAAERASSQMLMGALGIGVKTNCL